MVSVGDLASVFMFCGAVSVPLAFSFLFTMSAYSKYTESTSPFERRQSLLSIASGLAISFGCILYMSSAVASYMSSPFVFELALFASILAIVGAFGVGASSLLEWKLSD